MRIAAINHNRNVLGGIETYLRQLLPALRGAGHEVAFWHEAACTAGRESISLPADAPIWSVAELGAQQALNALRQWRPDVIYAHGLRSPELEAETQRVASSVFFAHSYYGACVSGAKTFRLPNMQPCERKFGRSCLVQYFPRRCGGLSPLALRNEYARQSKRLTLLNNYRALVVASSYMKREYAQYGLRERVNVVGLPVMVPTQIAPFEQKSADRRGWRLLFLGRMERLKGGDVLLAALPAVLGELGHRPLSLTFAGDGPAKANWERRAAQLVSAHPALEIQFLGWVNERERERLLRECDLLVMPSLWPEPFGLAGLEAGARGVPAAAFANGGITDWLQDGMNGALAASDPPMALNLARAIISCLYDQEHYEKLCEGARRQAQRFSMQAHLTALLTVLERAARA